MTPRASSSERLAAVESMDVRAVYRAAKVEGRTAPYDNITLKLHYPCRYSGSFEERDTGFIPPDPAGSPFPVVIIMPGINISLEGYGWLAHRLAKAGFVAATYGWVTREIGDRVSLSPGVQLDRLTRANYGQEPSCPALPAILAELRQVQSQGLLAGHLDLGRILLGGHSAGGSMALFNARPDWFPGVCGAFAYAAHSAGNLQLGWEAGSMMPITGDLPLLLMGGTRDGVITGSRHRYQKAGGGDERNPVERTFREAVPGEGGGRYLLMVEGASHFSFVWPKDRSTGRDYLDCHPQTSDREVRRYLGRVISFFCRQACRDDPTSAASLRKLCHAGHPLAAVAERK